MPAACAEAPPPLRAAQVEKITRLAELRTLLEEKFPAAPEPTDGALLTGLTSLDTQGGLRQGMLTELSSSTGGSSLFVEAMLRATLRARSFLALIDCGRTFDPQGWDTAALKRLLWVQSDSTENAVKAADLLLRDKNIEIVILDCQSISKRNLQRIPANTWHRFQRLVEQTNTAFLILTPQPIIDGARLRIAIRRRWALPVLRQRRRFLLEDLILQVFRRTALEGEPGEHHRIA